MTIALNYEFPFFFPPPSQPWENIVDHLYTWLIDLLCEELQSYYLKVFFLMLVLLSDYLVVNMECVIVLPVHGENGNSQADV